MHTSSSSFMNTSSSWFSLLVIISFILVIPTLPSCKEPNAAQKKATPVSTADAVTQNMGNGSSANSQTPLPIQTALENAKLKKAFSYRCMFLKNSVPMQCYEIYEGSDFGDNGNCKGIGGTSERTPCPKQSPQPKLGCVFLSFKVIWYYEDDKTCSVATKFYP